MDFPEEFKKQVEVLKKAGEAVEVLDYQGQCLVLSHVLTAPSPPWDKPDYDILIAVPAAYDAAALDGFYLALPYKFEGTGHPRVNGRVIKVNDRDWKLVSWHYADGKPWRQGIDTLETHIVHCRGFFLNRGARNAYR